MNAAPNATPDLKRFGRIVRKRREDLDMRQEDMRDAGGPSHTTMGRIERGELAPSKVTLKKLDAGLLWQHGSAAAALHGGEPELAGRQPGSLGRGLATLIPPIDTDADIQRLQDVVHMLRMSVIRHDTVMAITSAEALEGLAAALAARLRRELADIVADSSASSGAPAETRQDKEGGGSPDHTESGATLDALSGAGIAELQVDSVDDDGQKTG